MAQQTINVGTAPNDGTGTPLRTAFQYTNSNFSELYTAVGPSGNNIVVPGTATITGDLTVDTSTLKVDSANNVVGITNASPLIGTDGGLTVGVIGSSKAIAVSMFNCFARLRERDAVNNFAITTNIDTTNAVLDDNTRTSWKVRFGSGNDNFLIQRAAIGSTTFQDLYSVSTSSAVWSDGAGGTRMTLNSTGLGVGGSPVNFTNYTTIHAIGKTTTAGGVFQTSTSDNSTAGRLACNNTGVDLFVETNHPLSFYTNATVKMTLDASGNLLVGTTSALQLSNNAAVTSRIANLGSGSKGAAILRENEASQYWGGGLYLQKVRGASTAVQNGDSLGVIGFGGFDGTNYVNTGIIQTLVSGAVSAGVVPVKIQVIATSGGVELTNTATAWAAISDERLKDIIEPISNAVAKVGLLRSVIGKYKTDSEGTRRSFLIAQDVQSALPEAVGGDENNLTVRYTEVIPLLVAAIKELTARVQTLETR